MFPEPDRFRPERFIETTNPHLINFTLPFGYGRRICPGQHVALASVFIVTAKILATFNIQPVKDDKGRSILPEHSSGTTGLVCRPHPFPCAFVPRNADIIEVAMREADNADEQLKGWL